ncbi:uncharacterized protein BYT42DRAFT_571448 [Radiomyces spectabilis]|uniref:uncharacterized protein n=1 Tax=Radiomyces spectabilis TaxID=64574 RepID=UPI00221EBB97|nr:uncharacterized protein BYT42DRAFT_571448 [Radiomyces spectabilis]KAI8377742.1 hypothetical protein BYT42DRAFT_571448 [Radiomyces spectabilis]
MLIMEVSPSQLPAYHSIYDGSPTLLPENIANFITAASLATRLSLRCSSLLVETLFEAAKYSTVLTLGLSRSALSNALTTAKKLHALSSQSLTEEKNAFMHVLDKYTNLGIYIVHNTFTLAELFTLSGLQLTSQTIKSGLKTAEESVRIIDGIFGSNETSRAIASIVTLVHRELMQDPDFELANCGRIAILAGLTKALTAFAVLQNVTHKHMMKQIKITTLWKGLVIDEKKKPNQGLIQYHHKDTSDSQSSSSVFQPSDHAQCHPDVIQELEEFLMESTAVENDPIPDEKCEATTNTAIKKRKEDDKLVDTSPYDVYEITTVTERITKRTTRIQPIDLTKSVHEQPHAKYVVVKSEEEERDAYRAVVNRNVANGTDDDRSKSLAQRLNIMLCAISRKIAWKSVDRQEQYDHATDEKHALLEANNENSNEEIHVPETDTPSQPMPPLSNSVAADPPKHRRSSLPSLPPSNLPLSKDNSKNLYINHHYIASNNNTVIPLSQEDAKPSSAPRYRLHLSRSNSTTSVVSISNMATATMTTYTTSCETTATNHSHRSRRPSMHKPTSSSSPPSTSSFCSLDREPDSRNFPRNHIINNIAHFMRYASAAYGESFMRILGIGDIPNVFPASNHHHPNHHAFAHHTGVSVEDILLSSYTDHSLLKMNHPSMHALVHYVTVDHRAKAVVLTCRGTLGLSDVLTDLTCSYAEFALPTDAQPRRYRAHGGMLDAAQLLAKEKGKVYQMIRQGLERYPDYGLVLCGHSLGGGVVSLLSVLWSEERKEFLKRPCTVATSSLTNDPVPFVTSHLSGLPPGRAIHCYAYGPPGTMSLELSEYCGRGLVTSVVHGYDIVCSLSLGLLKDFKNIATSLHREGTVAEEIIGRIVGRYHNKASQPSEREKELDEDDQWFWAMIKTMRADMRTDKLYPPSTVYHIESLPHVAQDNVSQPSQYKKAHMVVLSRCDDVQARFSEIVFSRNMFMDHSPNMYENAIRNLCKGFFKEQEAYSRI